MVCMYCQFDFFNSNESIKEKNLPKWLQYLFWNFRTLNLEIPCWIFEEFFYIKLFLWRNIFSGIFIKLKKKLWMAPILFPLLELSSSRFFWPSWSWPLISVFVNGYNFLCLEIQISSLDFELGVFFFADDSINFPVIFVLVEYIM